MTANHAASSRNRRLTTARTTTLLLLLLAFPGAVEAQFSYTVNNGQITITGCSSPSGAVAIPSTINGLPVSSIGTNAFYGCTGLTSVTIPDSVSNIEYGAFANCYSLRSVTIPDNVTNLEYAAFGNCYSLTGVTLPSHEMIESAQQLCFDLSDPLPARRFYRAWQTNAPGARPVLDMRLATEIPLSGVIGGSVRVDYINQFGPTDAWVTLATVVLTNTTQLYFDTTMFRQPARLYRLTYSP